MKQKNRRKQNKQSLRRRIIGVILAIFLVMVIAAVLIFSQGCDLNLSGEASRMVKADAYTTLSKYIKEYKPTANVDDLFWRSNILLKDSIKTRATIKKTSAEVRKTVNAAYANYTSQQLKEISQWYAFEDEMKAYLFKTTPTKVSSVNMPIDPTLMAASLQDLLNKEGSGTNGPLTASGSNSGGAKVTIGAQSGSGTSVSDCLKGNSGLSSTTGSASPSNPAGTSTSGPEGGQGSQQNLGVQLATGGTTGGPSQTSASACDGYKGPTGGQVSSEPYDPPSDALIASKFKSNKDGSTYTITRGEIAGTNKGDHTTFKGTVTVKGFTSGGAPDGNSFEAIVEFDVPNNADASSQEDAFSEGYDDSVESSIEKSTGDKVQPSSHDEVAEANINVGFANPESEESDSGCGGPVARYGACIPLGNEGNEQGGGCYGTNDKQTVIYPGSGNGMTGSPNVGTGTSGCGKGGANSAYLVMKANDMLLGNTGSLVMTNSEVATQQQTASNKP